MRRFLVVFFSIIGSVIVYYLFSIGGVIAGDIRYEKGVHHHGWLWGLIVGHLMLGCFTATDYDSKDGKNGSILISMLLFISGSIGLIYRAFTADITPSYYRERYL